MSPADIGEQIAIDFPRATLSFEIRYIRREHIHPDPAQPRQHADDELRASIARNGILLPLTVRAHPTARNTFVIVDGERRWRGSEGILEQLPCVVREDQDDDALRLRTQLVANTGKPLAPIEEARAFAQLLEAQGEERSIEQLSEELGRATSSISERLALLELGPWIEWIDSGTIPVSHAVKVLVPFRGCAQSVHQHAREAVAKDYRFSREDGGISLSAFRQVVHQVYGRQLYPLTKTKATWDPQPRFDTKAHDQECDCGRILFALGSATAKRACCGNPAWWRPRDRKAKAAAPKKKDVPGSRAAREAVILPAGAGTMKVGWDSKATGVIALTQTYEPTWRVDDFDPSALELAADKLLLVQSPSGTYVATKDVAAVKEAQRRWRRLWYERRVALLEAVYQAMKEKGKAYRISGAGVGELLVMLDLKSAQFADACFSARVPCPAGFEDWDHWEDKAHRPALAGLTEAQQEKVATVIAFLGGTKTAFPSDAVFELIEKEKKKIAGRRLPWLGTPKTAKKTAGKKTSAVKPASRDAAEDDEEPWDEDEEE